MTPEETPSRPIDLLVVVLSGALCTLAVVALPHVTPLRAALGLPFILLGPGYALLSALYARERPELSLTILLTLALSLAATVLVGLLLNALRVHLTARSLLISLLVISIAACLVAGARRAEGPGPLTGSLAHLRGSPLIWSTAGLMVVFAALLVVLARPLPDSAFAGYTQLSALRARGSAVSVTVKSAEHARTVYRLVESTDSGFAISRSFALAPGQQWAATLPTGGAPAQTVYVRLYRAAAPGAVYREVVQRA